MSDEALRAWLVNTVAGYLGLPPSRVDADVALRSLGFDSVHAMGLCVDIEERWGILVDPTLAWDFPTVDAIVAHLRGEIERT
ncbi:acyl carrier protein [Actinosynnema sp. NPDC059335]|uniref:acyl carrier protein n=1 Tax=Actinosynnema sp. NPDC059335 TaxID=3346804 RepID=UPI00366E281C